MWGGALLALTMLGGPTCDEPALALELRVFDGVEEVTAQTRVAVHRAGERTQPVVLIEAGQGSLSAQVSPGIYDVQVIRQKDGRVLSIRWAERLVVMAYPDENGRHLEVINFQSGFGALEVRRRDRTRPETEVYTPADHTRVTAAPLAGADSALFVLPAGRYDLLTRSPGGPSWHLAIEVPADRTRFWIEPDPPASVRRADR